MPALAATLVLAACGGSDGDTLDKADRALAELKRGDFTVSVTARAGPGEGPSTAPVGFGMAGRFDLDPGTELPVLDVTYTRRLAEDNQVVTVQSDGTRVVVITDGEPAEVPPEQAQRPQLAEGGGSSGVGDLGVGGWVTDPTETDGPTVDGASTRSITGPVDAGDLVSDLAQLAGQISGQAETAPLDAEGRKRVQSRLRSGDVEILVDDDDLPRRVRATADFGAQVSPELQRALGPYAAAGLEVTLDVRAPGLAVTPPSLPL